MQTAIIPTDVHWPKSETQRKILKDKYTLEGSTAYAEGKSFEDNPYRKNSRAYDYWALAFTKACPAFDSYVKARALTTIVKFNSTKTNIVKNADFHALYAIGLQRDYAKQNLRSMYKWYLTRQWMYEQE